MQVLIGPSSYWHKSSIYGKLKHKKEYLELIFDLGLLLVSLNDSLSSSIWKCHSQINSLSFLTTSKMANVISGNCQFVSLYMRDTTYFKICLNKRETSFDLRLFHLSWYSFCNMKWQWNRSFLHFVTSINWKVSTTQNFFNCDI